MKFVLSLLVGLILAGQANSASVLWGLAATSIMGPAPGETSFLGAASLYFFYGNTSYFDVQAAFDSGGNLDTGNVAGGTYLDQGTTLGHGGTGEYGPVFDSQIQTSQLNPFFVVVVDPTSQYFKVGIGEQFGYDASDPQQPTRLMQFSTTSLDGNNAPWTPVPEPGTIMLALAGAGAFLAKRRKTKKSA